MMDYLGTALLDKSKVSWLHVPKCGSSFANTLLTYSCPDLPDDYHSRGDLSHDEQMKLKDYCSPGWYPACVHLPIGKNCHSLPKHSGNFVGLFRQPEQRLISAFYHNKHSVPHDYPGFQTMNMSEYARLTSGCAVKMLSGHKCTELDYHPSSDDVHRAQMTLETEFAFVGLTEEYDLSVCLFHKMFGSDCHEREFLNTRPGVGHFTSVLPGQGYQAYDTSALEGFEDLLDQHVWTTAQSLFWNNVKKFNVTRESCTEVCSAYPDPFLPHADSLLEDEGVSLYARASKGEVLSEWDWAGRPAYDQD